MLQPEEVDVAKDKVCCFNCIWYSKTNGFCRYNPPVPMQVNVSGMMVTTSMYPKVSRCDVDFCSKFKNEND